MTPQQPRSLTGVERRLRLWCQGPTSSHSVSEEQDPGQHQQGLLPPRHQQQHPWHQACRYMQQPQPQLQPPASRAYPSRQCMWGSTPTPRPSRSRCRPHPPACSGAGSSTLAGESCMLLLPFGCHLHIFVCAYCLLQSAVTWCLQLPALVAPAIPFVHVRPPTLHTHIAHPHPCGLLQAAPG